MPPLSPSSAHALSDSKTNYASRSATDSYYTDEEIAIILHVVNTAQESLDALPERERLPTNALFKSYDAILPIYGIDPEHDHHISRLVFRVGGERGDGSLREKLRAVLSRMDIKLEIDDLTSAVTPGENTSTATSQISVDGWLARDRAPAREGPGIFSRKDSYISESRNQTSIAPARTALLEPPDAGASDTVERAVIADSGVPLTSVNASTRLPDNRPSPYSGLEGVYHYGASDTTALSDGSSDQFGVDKHGMMLYPISAQLPRAKQITSDGIKADQPAHNGQRLGNSSPKPLYSHKNSANPSSLTDAPHPRIPEDASGRLSPSDQARDVAFRRHSRLVCRAVELWNKFRLLGTWNRVTNDTCERDAIARRHMARYRAFKSWLSVVGSSRQTMFTAIMQCVNTHWGFQLKDRHSSQLAPRSPRSRLLMTTNAWKRQVLSHSQRNKHLTSTWRLMSRNSQFMKWSQALFKTNTAIKRTPEWFKLWQQEEVLVIWHSTSVCQTFLLAKQRRLKRDCISHFDMQISRLARNLGQGQGLVAARRTTLIATIWAAANRRALYVRADGEPGVFQNVSRAKILVVQMWERALDHAQQLILWSDRAFFYVSASGTLETWSSKARGKRREKLRQSYIRGRRLVKRTRAILVFSQWLQASTRRPDANLSSVGRLKLERRTLVLWELATADGPAFEECTRSIPLRQVVIEWSENLKICHETAIDAAEIWMLKCMQDNLRLWDFEHIQSKGLEVMAAELKRNRERNIRGDLTRRWLIAYAQLRHGKAPGSLRHSLLRGLDEPRLTSSRRSLRRSITSSRHLEQSAARTVGAYSSLEELDEPSVSLFQPVISSESRSPWQPSNFQLAPNFGSGEYTAVDEPGSPKDREKIMSSSAWLSGASETHDQTRTPTRSTAFRLPHMQEPSTTPFAPVSTPYARELRRQLIDERRTREGADAGGPDRVDVGNNTRKAAQMDDGT